MKTKKVLAYLMAASVLVACGGHEEPENDEDFEDAVSAMGALGSAAASMMEADEAMNEEDAEELKEKAENIEKNLINYKELKAALPDEVNGFEKTDEDGETVKMGAFSISQASKTYQNGDKQLHVEIVDYALGTAMLKAATAMGMMEMESDDEYLKTLDFGDGIKGWEEYSKPAKSSKVTLVLNDRILLSIEVDNADPEDAVEVAEELDLDDIKDLSDN